MAERERVGQKKYQKYIYREREKKRERERERGGGGEKCKGRTFESNIQIQRDHLRRSDNFTER